jgi:hypothetical protein
MFLSSATLLAILLFAKSQDDDKCSGQYDSQFAPSWRQKEITEENERFYSEYNKYLMQHRAQSTAIQQK